MESVSVDDGVVEMKRGSVDITLDKLDRLSMCSVKTIDEEVRQKSLFFIIVLFRSTEKAKSPLSYIDDGCLNRCTMSNYRL